MHTSQSRRLIDRSIIEFAEGLSFLRQATAAMAASLDVAIETGEYAAIIKTRKIPDEAELKQAFAN